MKRLVVFSVLVIGVSATVLHFLQPKPVLVSSTQPELASHNNAQTKTTNTTSAAAIDLEELQTFRGATVDGALRTDHRGQLVIDMQLRHWIDFHLTAMGEVALSELKHIMQQQIQQLPQPGQQQALDLLDAYLGYLNALADYDAEEARRLAEPQMSDVEARLRWQQRLRREWLEPKVVEAFFSAEESIDEYTLASLRLRKDGASDEQLAALESTLPDPIQQMRQESRQLITMREHEKHQRQQGASHEEVHQWRVQEYGVEAAERLAQVDKQQAQWQQRLKQYQRYQQKLAQQNLAKEDNEQQLQAYRNKHFSEAEQKRLGAALALLQD